MPSTPQRSTIPVHLTNSINLNNSGFAINSISNQVAHGTKEKENLNVSNQKSSTTPNRKNIPFTDPSSPFYKEYIEMSKPLVLQAKVPD